MHILVEIENHITAIDIFAFNIAQFLLISNSDITSNNIKYKINMLNNDRRDLFKLISKLKTLSHERN